MTKQEAIQKIDFLVEKHIQKILTMQKLRKK